MVESGHPGLVDADNNGVVDGPDADGDGINDSADGNDAAFGDASDPTPVNTDGTDVPDYRDPDSDNDGTNDIVEKANLPALDANGDGKVDNPTDPDGDGIANNGGLDTKPTTFGGLPTPDLSRDTDLFPNFTFGNTTNTVGDEKMVVININNILSEATTGNIEVFVPFSTGFTYTFDAALTSATVLAAEAVNNPDWTMTQTGVGMKFTTTKVIAGNGRSRIALKVKADVKGTDANLTVNITPKSGGENKDSNNVAVLGMSIQN